MLPSPDLLTRSCFGLVLLCVKLCIVSVTSGCNGYVSKFSLRTQARQGKAILNWCRSYPLSSKNALQAKGRILSHLYCFKGLAISYSYSWLVLKSVKHVKAMNPIYRVCLLLLHFCVFSFHMSVCPFRKDDVGVCAVSDKPIKCGQTVGWPFSRIWGLMDAC